jgi:hypothetical protein
MFTMEGFWENFMANKFQQICKNVATTKARTFILGLAFISVSLFISSSALAVCKAGKVGVTIINPAGKVKEICVAEAAVSKIGGPGDVVISAVCPCFSQEDVQAMFNSDPSSSCGVVSGVTFGPGEPCTKTWCVGNSPWTRFMSGEGPDNSSLFGWNEHTGNCVYPETIVELGAKQPANECWYSTLVGGIWFSYISETQSKACSSILDTFIP